MIFYDSETCGLHGVAVLLQYAEDDGPINLVDLWLQPVSETLKLIEMLMTHEGGVVGFNLTFDHFHLQKLYNMFSLLAEVAGPEELPYHHVETLAELEPLARDGKCIKPVKALDLMLHARKGKFQSLMARKPIMIRRVPTALSYYLRDELEKRVKIDEIYFARCKVKPEHQWQIKDVKDKNGAINPQFKDIMLDFKAAGGLKPLCEHLFGKDRFGHTRSVFKEVAISKKLMPQDKGTGYAPFAKAFEKAPYRKTWPAYVQRHILHWKTNEPARQYAQDDVTDTRHLYYHFRDDAGGTLDLGDDDSELACMAGSVRWRGFPIKIKALKNLRDEARERVKSIPRKPSAVRAWLCEVMTPTEAVKLELDKSTKKQVLIEIQKLKTDIENADGSFTEIDHPAAERAKKILEARQAKYEINFYTKLIQAGRLHPSFEIIGAKSTRMSGRGGDLNSQGIKKDKRVRSCFTLHNPNNQESLCGGDFESFEVSIAVADYNDPVLYEELNSGKKIHGLFGTLCFPKMTYEEIVATDGAPGDGDYYTKAKSGLFALIYGGNEETLRTRLNVEIEDAKAALARFRAKYKGVAAAQDRIRDAFGSMRQPDGIGTRVEWHDPQDYMESMLGFRRFFTLENQICKILFDLGNKPPQSWRAIKVQVMRRDRVQSASGATQSALYGGAFQLQAANMRAAGNHRIQSTGAQITKKLQRNVWGHQPSGVHDWLVQPMNIHDEVLARTSDSIKEAVAKTVEKTVESYRPIIPMIGIGWKLSLENWASK